jgi:hypothetical protein
MKTSICCVIVSVLVFARAWAFDDPVQDYLAAFSPLGGDEKVYADDRLLRIDVDVNGDAKKDVLLSMARDRNGKRGNVWVVYRAAESGYVRVGGMSFDQDQFYVGPIDGINKTGVVSFWPGGGSGGGVYAYIVGASDVQSSRLGEVVKDSKTGEVKGGELLGRYFGANAIDPEKVVSVIDSIELSEKYGVKIETKSYQQSLIDSENQPKELALPISRPAPPVTPETSLTRQQETTSVIPNPGSKVEPVSVLSVPSEHVPVTEAGKVTDRRWPWIAVVVTLVVIGTLWGKRYR